MPMKFKAGDKIVFVRGFDEGQKGTLLDIKTIGGINWYSIKMEGGSRDGMVLSGQYEGDFVKVSDNLCKRCKKPLSEHKGDDLICPDVYERFQNPEGTTILDDAY